MLNKIFIINTEKSCKYVSYLSQAQFFSCIIIISLHTNVLSKTKISAFNEEG